MTTLTMSTFTPNSWRRTCKIGLAIHGVLVVCIGALAYQGALWRWLPGIAHFDFMAHLVLMGMLAFWLDGALGYRSLYRGAPGWLRAGPVGLLIAVAVEEFVQRWAPTRSSSWSDFVADTIGIVALSWLSKAVCERMTREGSEGRERERFGGCG